MDFMDRLAITILFVIMMIAIASVNKDVDEVKDQVSEVAVRCSYSDSFILE